MALDMDKIRAKQAELNGEKPQGGSGDNKRFTPAEGDNHIRILPPTEGEDEFYFEFSSHFGVGPSQVTVDCPKSLNKKAKCPICDVVFELYKGDDEDKKIASGLRAKTRFRTNIINLDRVEDGVQIYEFGKLIAQDLLGFITDDDYGDITDLETGHDITIKRTGKGRDTRYTVIPRSKSSKCDSEVMLLAHDLKATFKLKTREEIQAILDGEDEEDSGDDYATPTPAAKVKAPVKAAPAEVIDEEVEEEAAPAPVKAAPAPVKAAPAAATSKDAILARLKSAQKSK